MTFRRWDQFRQFVDWRLGIKGQDEGTDFDAEGWGDFGG